MINKNLETFSPNDKSELEQQYLIDLFNWLNRMYILRACYDSFTIELYAAYQIATFVGSQFFNEKYKLEKKWPFLKDLRDALNSYKHDKCDNKYNNNEIPFDDLKKYWIYIFGNFSNANTKNKFYKIKCNKDRSLIRWNDIQGFYDE